MNRKMATGNQNKSISRRGFFGVGLLLPFLNAAQPLPTRKEEVEEDEFTTMLTTKGTVVRVRKSALKTAKVVERKMSNKSLFNWLKLNINK